MDPTLFSLPGPSRYRQSNTNEAGTGTISPASLDNNFDSRSRLDFDLGIGSSTQRHQFTPNDEREAILNELSRGNANPGMDGDGDEDLQEGSVEAMDGGDQNHALEEFLENFWSEQVDNVERADMSQVAGYTLPLARIKKVMKSDEDVKMISAEVPIMFSKACEIFISELTCRAWLIAESHKRRTLQKSDIAAAIACSDMFDFLIDIVPGDNNTAEETGGGEGEPAAQNEIHGNGEDQVDQSGDRDLYDESYESGEPTGVDQAGDDEGGYPANWIADGDDDEDQEGQTDGMARHGDSSSAVQGQRIPGT